jgi:spore germination protein KC
VKERRWNKYLKACLVLLLTFPFLSGCWDRLEIEERSFVLGFAIDQASPEKKEEKKVTHSKENFPKPTTGKIRLTAQVAIQGRIPLGPAQGDGGGGSGGQKPVWVLSVTGDTVDDAIMNLQQQMAYRLFFGHLRVIVISEEIAKKGIQNINDYFRRNSEIRRTVWMLVSKGEAKKALLTAPPLERVPTLYLIKTIEQAVNLGKFPLDFIGIFWSASSAKGREPFLPYIEIKGDNILLSGIAYFRGDQMVGTTEPHEIAIAMEVMGIETGGYSVLKPAPDQHGAFMAEATGRKTKIRVEIRNGKPHVIAKIHVEANLVEKSTEQFAVNKPIMLKKLEQVVEKGLGEGQKKLVKKTQQKGADIFGFGEYVRAKHPKFWNEHVKTDKKWQEMYKDITFKSDVLVSIRRVGMKAK